jgi:hypothetical protein
MHAARCQRVAAGGQTPLPWRILRSVIDSIGPAVAEFALPSMSSGERRKPTRRLHADIRFWE